MSAVATRPELNDEQFAAVEATGEVFVSAGAGTGKTSVLVERFVRAVCEGGLDVDSVLVVTYTNKAAGELRARIRSALVDRGRHDLARELDGAWISTIHGFCARLLRAHPIAVGLDPRFREIDDAGAAVLRGEAFERALTTFCEQGEEERLRLLTTYQASGLRRMLTGVYETLRSAGRELVLELGERGSLEDAVRAFREAAAALAGDGDATSAQRANAQQALDVVGEAPLPERVIELGALRASGTRAVEYESARRALERAGLEELAADDRDLLQRLLELYAAEYADGKRRESVVDFEDLQLAARGLLRDDAGVRDAESARFRMIMVDEFQDTNRLQCEIVDLLTRPGETERFFVGDEFQSIYGFRHADVQVFRERREGAENVLSLVRNYRSRPEVLDAVNHLFSEEFGGEFQPLTASGEFSHPAFGHPVELLVTDKTRFSGPGDHWRRAEARSVAQRIRELVETDAAAPGEIVLLFAAGTDAETYENELRREGLPTYRATGRGYFVQQQVTDLLAYLRLLRNRYDDLALATVLASPFVGVSNDALVLVRRRAGRRPLFTGLEKGVPESLATEDERLLRAFLQRYERLVAASQRMGLERLCEQVIAEHDYDLAVLAHWDGRRRYANLRKLARLARAYEALRGTDIEGFVRLVADQHAFGAKELEAVSEEEGADAVRLLTIHAAKGLEFKVVVVADAGRDTGRPPGPDEIVALSDGRFGFKVAHPAAGRRPVFEYEAVSEEAERQERAERLRLYYVAMTRAIDRLIVSGAIDVSRAGDLATPIGWVLDRLGALPDVAAAGDEPVELERGDARFILRSSRHSDRPVVDEEEADDVPEESAQLALFGELAPHAPGAGLVFPPLAPLPQPAGHDPRRLSYSALSLFETCSYRYWAERVAGMRGAGGDEEPGEHQGLLATEHGDAVHRLLELVALDDPRSPAPDELAATVRSWYPTVTEEELTRMAGHVSAYCDSPLARRIAALGGARPERPFTFEHDGVLLHGRLDVLWLEGARALVLDYKTNRLEGASPSDVVDGEYRLQRLVYALACLRAGAEDVEVAYQFLERPDDVVSTTFDAGDTAALEAELSAAIARIRDGDFRPTPSAFACSGCPALGAVCAGPGLLTGRGGA